ncbi:MgtC/SapB family protein [Gelidibacter maritimus]|uniref:MgtC/SapB family protein n=1 Tax=Gelidibacter maritimus TaxID=2761487 RepID=A0A7W2M4I5_9FLAO|nr:MgtC/SapB family protein [Gelidibacter maritimus]MBA6152316.1 MgtC/SapB family protein [Gelidibacter maritimus]
MNYEDLTTLGIAFGLGLLVGMQREKHNKDQIAGVRTFTLISVLGVVAGFLTRLYENPYVLPLTGLAMAAMLITANIMKLKKQDNPTLGQTTEMAALLMFAIGAYLVVGDRVVGVIMGAAIAILLYVKDHLHRFIGDLEDNDVSAIMILAGISLIILPILPDETFGPLNVLNLRNIWLMVTLIVGISVIGYFIYKFIGKKYGILSNGILGGIISSTATTVSYARFTKNGKNIHKASAFVIFAAATVSLVRVMIEIGAVIPAQLSKVVLPIVALFILMIGLSVVLFYLINKESTSDDMPKPKNPAQLTSALMFGAIYAFILLAVAFTEQELGNSGLYVAAFIGGLANKDAITLSLSQSIGNGLETNFGWRLIVVACLSNFLFKIVLCAILGTKVLTKWMALFFGAAIGGGLLILWLWPETWHV